MAPQPQKTVMLDPQRAQELYLKQFPPSYKVAQKFMDDHTISANLSKQTSIKAALDRYQRNQRILASSWIVLSRQDLISKAEHARKMASVHQGKQQMTLEIKVIRRTVTIRPLSKQELQRYTYETVQFGRDTRYLNCSSEEKEVKLSIMGEWKPLTGEIELFHYEEGPFPAAPALLPQYLQWTKSGDEVIGPAAKR